MIKKKLIILLFGFSLWFSSWQSVQAVQQKSLEKSYYNLGYKSVSDAKKEAESYFKTKLNLPQKLPPLTFTHSFGRFIGNNNINDGLEVEYLNDGKHFNYIINVRPLKNKIKLPLSSKINLKDGKQADYYTIREGQKKLIVFNFDKNGWNYTLSIQEKLLDNALSTLVKIAESV
ncbi:carbon monoxide dehydrogenase [Gottfriedia sp. NPDC057991]|uniref:carbon monoxide dehydrogenase n=1 Tax=Gottfriedia sp. NPDC057991 TaxID=3346298 RepID=UPI0036DA0034